jgi:hypothetical protein
MAEPVAALQHGRGVFSRRANGAVPTLQGMDLIFILIIAVLYAATHWLTWALSRLGGVE